MSLPAFLPTAWDEEQAKIPIGDTTAMDLMVRFRYRLLLRQMKDWFPRRLAQLQERRTLTSKVH